MLRIIARIGQAERRPKFLFSVLTFSFILFFLPFHEGGARAGSLLVVHSIVFLLLIFLGLEIMRGKLAGVFIPRPFLWFVPFIIYLTLRSFYSPYLYASLLSLWEVLIFFVLFLLAFQIARQNRLESGSFTETILLSFFLSAILQSSLAILFFITQGFKRSAVYFLNPNHLAAFLSMGFFIGAYFLLRSRSGDRWDDKKMVEAGNDNDITGEKAGQDTFEEAGFRKDIAARQEMTESTGKGTSAMKWFFAAGLLLILIAFVMTSSRGALLSFLLALAFLIVMLRKKLRKREALVALVILSVIALAGLSFILHRFAGVVDIYKYERVRIWGAGISMFLDHAVFGLGPGMFKYHALGYNFPQTGSVIRFSRYFSTPHSDYILVLAELGAIGFALFVIPLILIPYKLLGGRWSYEALRRGKRRSDGRQERGIQEDKIPVERKPDDEGYLIKASFLSLLVALLVQALFDNLSGRPALYMSLSILAGAILPGLPGLKRLQGLTGSTESKGLPGFPGLMGSSGQPGRLRLDSIMIRVSHPIRGVSFLLTFLVPLFFLYYLGVFSPFMGSLFIQKALSASVADSQKRLMYCDRVLFFNPIHPDYYATKGSIARSLLEQGELSQELFLQSEQNFAKAISLNPVSSKYPEDMARLYETLFYKGFAPDLSFEQAVRYYSEAESKAPKNPFLPRSKGLFLWEAKDVDRAEEEFLKSLAIEPYDFLSSLSLARIYIERGDVGKAREAIEKMERQFRELEGYKLQNRYEFELLQYDRKAFLEIKEKIGKE